MAIDVTGIGALASVAESLLSRVWPDPTKQAEALYKIKELEQKGNFAELSLMISTLTSQLEINKKEAEHPSVFVAGWRPAVGWTCVFALTYASIVEPILRFMATVVFGYNGDFPILNDSLTDNILIPLLGLGAARTYERVKGAEGTKRTS